MSAEASSRDPHPGSRAGGRLLRLFFASSPGRQVRSAVLLMAGLAEGFGVAALLPLLSLATGSIDASVASPMHQAIVGLLARLEIEPTLPYLFAVVMAGLAGAPCCCSWPCILLARWWRRSPRVCDSI